MAGGQILTLRKNRFQSTHLVDDHVCIPESVLAGGALVPGMHAIHEFSAPIHVANRKVAGTNSTTASVK